LYGYAPLAQWDGKATGANAEFKSGACPGQVAEDLNGWLNSGGFEELWPQQVIPLSNPFVEV
jgi:hypothetical protein